MRSLFLAVLFGFFCRASHADLLIDDFSSGEYVRTGEFTVYDPGTMLGGERRSSSFSDTAATIAVGNGVYSILNGVLPPFNEGFYLSWGTPLRKSK